MSASCDTGVATKKEGVGVLELSVAKVEAGTRLMEAKCCRSVAKNDENTGENSNPRIPGTNCVTTH